MTDPASPSQVFFGLILRRHEVPAEHDPGEVRAGVAADREDHEHARPVRAVGLRQHQRDERRHDRQVDAARKRRR